MGRSTISALLTVFALAACTPEKAPPAGSFASDDCADAGDGLTCHNQLARECRGGELVSEHDCRADDQLCVPLRGCLTCLPGTRSCAGQQQLTCNQDGSGYVQGELCAEGLQCSERGCVDLCAQARSDRSYIGCEYYPVFTSNEGLDPRFRPAVVIANPNLVPADVQISGGEHPWPSVQVAPQGVETVMLDYSDALERPLGSAIVRGGAYHLVSSVPVTVHQFNPLLYEVAQDCVKPEGDSQLRVSGDRKCNSFSNDASLLVPTHVLERPPEQPISYLALARASLLVSRSPEGPFMYRSPGFVAVVAVGSGPVQVKVTSSAFTRPSVSADGADPVVPALAPGEQQPPVTLMPGDVLQLLSDAPEGCSEPPVASSEAFACPLGAEYDLSGTAIQADGPIAVLGGHNCAYVPLGRTACDHLEESMFPVDTWGLEAVAARPRAGAPQPHVVRVLSAADDNLVRFIPEVREPQRLGRGELIEFETTEHLVVRGEKPIAVAQYLVGQNGQARVGDPSMSLAIPSEQFRARYAFLSPSTYDANYVSIIAQVGDTVVLDGDAILDFEVIEGTQYQVASVRLLASGAHEVHSQLGAGIGLQVYGFGDYTSYMLPGGLDLRPLGTLF